MEVVFFANWRARALMVHSATPHLFDAHSGVFGMASSSSPST